MKDKEMNETKLTAPQCALCSEKDKVCRVIEGSGPAYCPTYNKKKSIEKAIKEYENPEIENSLRQLLYKKPNVMQIDTSNHTYYIQLSLESRRYVNLQKRCLIRNWE